MTHNETGMKQMKKQVLFNDRANKKKTNKRANIAQFEDVT